MKTQQRARLTQTKTVTLTDEERAFLNARSEREFSWLAKEGVLAHDQVDRDFERFSPELLGDFAKTLPGRALLVGHDSSSLPEGTWFRASVEEDGDQRNLKAAFAIPVLDDEANRALRGRVESGVARYLSIGFQAEDLICDICGKSVWGSDCPHLPGMALGEGKFSTATWMAPGEAREGSLVWLGAQQGAEVKAATGDHYIKAAESGELFLAWPELAVQAVRIAGARGDGGLSESDRKAAWLDICRSYRTLGKSVPSWWPVTKFEWDQFSENERGIWEHTQAISEAKRVSSIIDSRIVPAVAHLRDGGGPLPEDVRAALAPVKAAVESLLPAPKPNADDEPADTEESEDATKAAGPDPHDRLLDALSQLAEPEHDPLVALRDLA